MNKTLSITARFVGAAALVGAALVGTATTATAGGCDPFNPSCNQTGGEMCVDHAKVDPNTGEIIGYTNICTDLTTDWNEQTPDCNCKPVPATLPHPAGVGSFQAAPVVPRPPVRTHR